jgi:hypothetical protein
MAKINIYPLGTPKSNDLLVGTSIPNPNTNKLPKTKNFPVSDIVALTQSEIGSVINSVDGGSNITAVTNASAVTVSAPNAIVNTTDTFGGPTVVNIVCLTSAQYPPATVDVNTLYVII